MTLKARIKLHEGLRNKVYSDSVGILTIGYGRNLEDVGISDAEADYLFERDFKYAQRQASSLGVYENMNSARQGVLTEMVFQIGLAGVLKFKRFLTAAGRHEWDKAAGEMLDSKWHTQTKQRAETLAEIFRSGIDV